MLEDLGRTSSRQKSVFRGQLCVIMQAGSARRNSTGRWPAGNVAAPEGSRAVHVFVETPRLVLRRFTMADVDNLVSLDADPDVMQFVTGGIPTTRDEIETEILPAFLGYYERYGGVRLLGGHREAGRAIPGLVPLAAARGRQPG
jgi:hypothetical protein